VPVFLHCQEELHQALVKKRDLRDKRAAKTDGSVVRTQSMSGDCRLPLHLMKTKMKKSLQNLELANVVTRKDGYQEIINLIAQVGFHFERLLIWVLGHLRL
jgi:hypothetical protein